MACKRGDLEVKKKLELNAVGLLPEKNILDIIRKPWKKRQKIKLYNSLLSARLTKSLIQPYNWRTCYFFIEDGCQFSLSMKTKLKEGLIKLLLTCILLLENYLLKNKSFCTLIGAANKTRFPKWLLCRFSLLTNFVKSLSWKVTKTEIYVFLWWGRRYMIPQNHQTLGGHEEKDSLGENYRNREW